MKLTLLERALQVISPEAAHRRVVARYKTEVLTGVRNYDGASRGRRVQNWFASNASPDAILAGAGSTLRARSADLYRNNPTAKKIVAIWTNHLVGNGIMPRANTGDEKVNEKLDELFEAWSRKCVADGIVDFYGAQSIIVREMVIGGECFIRKRTRRRGDKLRVPLQIQILPAEFCDQTKSGAGDRRGSTIIMGIEHDVIGMRRGYWMHGQHPGSSIVSDLARTASAFVPADEVCHVFDPERAQTRGVPWLAPIMIPLKDIDDYNSAENVRKKIEACHVAVVIPGDNEEPDIGATEMEGDTGQTITDAWGNPVERFEPGMILYAHGGKEVKFNNPAISAGLEMYLRTQYRRVASGARVPYELVTGDFSQSNFASGRMGILDFRRLVTSLQWQVLIHQFCQPVWDWFVEACIVAGEVPGGTSTAVEWQPPEFESINPIDDARADLLDVRMGKRTLKEIIAKTGRNPKAVLKEHAETAKELDEAGLTLDSDPRKTAINGQVQWVQDSEDNQGDKPNAD